MKHLLWVFALLLAFVACSNDDNPAIAFDKSKITASPDFVDPRDNNVYKTIRIGNQVWMTENLRYAPAAYSLDGAYTWGENAIKRESILPADSDIVALIIEIADDAQYNGWPDTLPSGRIIQRAATIKMYTRFLGTRLSMNELLTGYKESFPAFYAVLSERIESLAGSPSVLAKVGYQHFLEAEEKNKGYVATNGFLYSYEGALKAVPEGWRLPSDADWLTLERTLGLSLSEAERFEAFRGEGLSPLMDTGGASGFNATKSGCNAYIKENSNLYLNRDKAWYYWSSTKQQLNDSTEVAIIRFSSKMNTKVWRGTSRLTNHYRPMLYSVRCVRDE